MLGILAAETIRAKQLIGCSLKPELKKEGKGAMNLGVLEQGDVLVRWPNKGVVNIASTQVVLGDVGVAKGWRDTAKARVGITFPKALLNCNPFMSGMDKLDFECSGTLPHPGKNEKIRSASINTLCVTSNCEFMARVCMRC